MTQEVLGLSEVGKKMRSRDPETKLVVSHKSERVIEKPSYFLGRQLEKKSFFEDSNSRIFIAGMDTDACVYAVALELFEKGFEVNLIEDACLSSGGEELHHFGVQGIKRNAFAKIWSMKDFGF